MESTNSGYNLPAQYEVLVCSSEQRLNGSRSGLGRKNITSKILGLSSTFGRNQTHIFSFIILKLYL